MKSHYFDMSQKGNFRPLEPVRYIDLFCGIGGFRTAMENLTAKHGLKSECVFSSDIDEECRRSYKENFKHKPEGDITKIEAKDVPDHDLLLAGFPCQPFSIIGHMKGFEDTRGTLFFDIARILAEKKPRAFVLENVKLLKGHNKGETLKHILKVLKGLGYHTESKVLNALDFGLPQKRERIFIVGFLEGKNIQWPEGKVPMKALGEVLETKVPKKYYVSDRIREKRWSEMKPGKEPTIWHENKSGHISAYPFSCALRAGASYNYLLVDGKRRLTPREMFRLQGFPETFDIISKDHQARKQAGNSVPVPVVEAVLKQVCQTAGWLMSLHEPNGNHVKTNDHQSEAEAPNGRKIRATLSAQ